MLNIKRRENIYWFNICIFWAFLILIITFPQIAFTQRRIIKLPTIMGPQHHSYIAAEKFANIINEKTRGKIEIQTFPSGQLGNEKDYVELMQMGTLEMGIVSTNIMENFVPIAGLTTLPYVIRDFDHGDKVHDGPIGQAIKDAVLKKTGLRSLFFVTYGIRNVLAADKPILKLEDFKGLKIRTPPSPAFVESFKLLGSNPAPIPSSEYYTAFQTRIVDAVEGTPDVLQDYKMFEIGKHYTLTGHIYTDGCVLIRDKIWQELSIDTRKIFEEASREADLYQRKLLRSAQEEAFNLIKKQGVKIYRIDTTPIVEKVKPYYLKISNRVGGMELIQAVIDTR